MMALASAVTLLLASTITAAAPAAGDLPACGERQLVMPDGIQIAIRVQQDPFLESNTASLYLRLPLATRHKVADTHTFTADSAIIINVDMPRGRAERQTGFAWGALRAPDMFRGGTLQLSCGRRHMGLVNFHLSLGMLSSTSTREEIENCVDELERDGAYALSFDRRGISRPLLHGSFNLRAAWRAAERYAMRERRRADAHACEIRDLPQPFRTGTS